MRKCSKRILVFLLSIVIFWSFVFEPVTAAEISDSKISDTLITAEQESPVQAGQTDCSQEMDELFEVIESEEVSSEQLEEIQSEQEDIVLSEKTAESSQETSEQPELTQSEQPGAYVEAIDIAVNELEPIETGESSQETSELIEDDVEDNGLVPPFLVDSTLSLEEYELAKQAFVSQLGGTSAYSLRRNVLNNNVLSNDYIEFAVNPENGRFTVGTTGGNPEVSSDNYKKLLYGHSSPSTSYTTINMDGISYIYGDNGFTVSPYFTEDSNISEINLGDISIKQIISIVGNMATMRDDVVEVKYVVTNNGTEDKEFGLRIMMDTMLGSNDAAPFRLPTVGNVTTEKEFVGNSIPQYWQAFDSLTAPTVVSYGNFAAGKIKPSKVQFTNWSRVYNKSWDYTISSDYSNGDSAVSVIWERTLKPGMEETYVTRYGLSELVQDLRPPLGVTIASGSSIQIDTESNEYMPYVITAYVENLGDAAAESVVCKIKLADGLRFSTQSENGIIQLGDIEPGEVRTVEKTIYVKDLPKEALETYYEVEVSADNTSSKTVSRELNIEPLAKALIILPGIAGSRLYANEDVNTEDYLKGFASSFQSGKPDFYEFKKGHMLWEPYTSTLGKIKAGSVNQNKVQSEIMMLLCDQQGASAIDMAINGPSATEYGAQNTYEKLVKALVEEYKDEYDVCFFSYDWRMSNKKSAEKLESYINEKNYSSVTLVCHSMGGLVASEYLSRSTENQEKVNKLITMGTPYLGSPKALYVMETGNFLDGVSNFFCMATPLKLVAGNIYGLNQLLPPEKYFTLNSTTYVEQHQKKKWAKDIKQNLNYSQTFNLLAQRSWAQGTYGVKAMYSTSNDFYNGLFTNNNHIIHSVDSYVVIGYGIDTIMELSQKYNADGSFDKCKDITVLNGGDGTVPLISANIGGLAPNGRTYYIVEDHSGLPQNADVINLVQNIIDGNPNTYNSTISTTQPTTINDKGWFGINSSKKIKIKIECPVTLSLLDDNGEEWAYVSDNLLINENDDKASLYVLGENNDTKIAYLSAEDNSILLTGVGEGVMTYTASIMDAGYEIERNVFVDVPITESTRIYTDTDFANGIVLKVDIDNDGEIDNVIQPSAKYTGTDLETELEEHDHICEMPTYVWAEDYSSCTAVFECMNCDACEDVECIINVAEVLPTHISEGQIVYTAVVEIEDRGFTDTKTVIIPALGHTYSEPVFVWAEDMLSCSVSFECIDGDDTQILECYVTQETLKATAQKDGQITYTATVVFEGKNYTDVKVESIPATGENKPCKPVKPIKPVQVNICKIVKDILKLFCWWKW